MAKALFITSAALKKNTIINGSTDPDKFVSYMFLAQDIHLHNYLGGDLYTRLSEGIIADDLTANEIILMDDYIQDTLIHFAMAEYLPFSAYTIGSGGTYKHTSENAESVSKSEIDSLAAKHRSYAENYAQKMVDYLKDNDGLYPEYLSSEYPDVIADSEVNNAGGLHIS